MIFDEDSSTASDDLAHRIAQLEQTLELYADLHHWRRMEIERPEAAVYIRSALAWALSNLKLGKDVRPTLVDPTRGDASRLKILRWAYRNVTNKASTSAAGLEVARRLADGSLSKQVYVWAHPDHKSPNAPARATLGRDPIPPVLHLPPDLIAASPPPPRPLRPELIERETDGKRTGR